MGITHLLGASEDTAGIIGAVVSCLSFVGLFLFSYKDDMDVVKNKFKEVINGIGNFFKFLIGAIIFIVIVIIIFLALPFQFAFWGWVIKFLIIAGGIGLLVMLIYSTIEG